MFTDSSEEVIRGTTTRYANLALVSLWTNLLMTEYRSTKHQILVRRHILPERREILLTLSERSRSIFIDCMIGSFNRLERFVRPRDEEESRLDRLYDRALFAWRALGTTVLMNSLLTADATNMDENLILEGISFKRWYFRQCFEEVILDDQNRPSWPGIDRTITLIKRLSAWTVYYGAFSDEVEKPRRIDPLPGSHPDFQDFTWFGGSLYSLRKPYLLSPNKTNVHTLATMSGFGRALPPPSMEVAQKDALESLSILSTKPSIDPFWVNAFHLAARRVVRGLKRLPVVTHCSINATACFERTTDKGGTASYVVEEVNNLLNLRIDESLSSLSEVPEVGYDPFGREVYGKALHWVVTQRKINSFYYHKEPSIQGEVPSSFAITRPMVFGNIAYRDSFLNPEVNSGKQWSLPNANPFGFNMYNIDIVTLLGDDRYVRYNETLGDIVLLWAWSESLQYGHFEDLTGMPVNPIFSDLAIFAEPGIKVWVQDIPIPAKMLALEEPGFKARTLTKNRAFLVILQAALRHPIAEVLESDGRVGLGLKSSYILWDFLKLVKGVKFDSNWYSVNTDLSKATDLIPFEIIDAIWSGFLPGVGLNGKHPLYSLKNMVQVDHTIHFRMHDGTVITAPHLCGSFQGEPISFMGLSLYNMCVTEITSYMVRLKCKPFEQFNLEKFSMSGPTPTGYVCIVGDDRKEITNIPGVFPILNSVYRATNALPSPGKNTVSKYHGVLAENHTFFEGTTISYLDIVKPKLLTPSCRFHSDNRTSLIGKGAALYIQLNWLESTHPVKGSCSVDNARNTYTLMVLNGFFPKDIRRALTLPICLPTSVGGINFPISYKACYQLFGDEIDFLWNIVNHSDIMVFFSHAIRIKEIASNTRRALETPGYSKIWKKQISAIVVSQQLIFKPEFNPLDQKGMYSLDSILNFVELLHRSDVPISRTTGKPHVALTIEYVYETYGFLPLEALLDMWERQETFLKAFTEGVTHQERLSFHKYVGNLKRYWTSVQEHSANLIVERSKFSSMDDLHWKFSKRLKTFVHKNMCGGGTLSSGPTLVSRLHRKKGVSRTETAREDMLLHAISAYVARVRQEFEENFVDEVVGASAPPHSPKLAISQPPSPRRWEVKVESLKRADRLLIR